MEQEQQTSLLGAKQLLVRLCGVIMDHIGVLITPEDLRLAKYNNPKSIKVLWKLLFGYVAAIEESDRPFSPEAIPYVVAWCWHHGYRRVSFFQRNLNNISSRELLLAFIWLTTEHDSILFMDLHSIVPRILSIRQSLSSPLNINNHSSRQKRTNPPKLRVRNTGSGAGLEQIVVCRCREVVAALHKLRLAISEHGTLLHTVLKLQVSASNQPRLWEPGPALACSTADMEALIQSNTSLLSEMSKLSANLPIILTWWKWSESVVCAQSAQEQSDVVPSIEPTVMPTRHLTSQPALGMYSLQKTLNASTNALRADVPLLHHHNHNH